MPRKGLISLSKIPLRGTGMGDLGSGEGADFSPRGVIPDSDL